MKTIFFEVVGAENNLKQTDIKNDKLRSEFINNDNQKIYIDLSRCPRWGINEFKRHSIIFEWALSVNTVYNMTIDKPIKISNQQTRNKYDYNKCDILKFINEQLNCSFTDLQLLNESEE